MNILYFEIDGFKNIENAHIDVDDITALMSLNSKGKSNLLKGMLFGLHMLSQVSPIKDNIYFNQYTASYPLNKKRKGEDFKFKISFETILENKVVVVDYSYVLEWSNAGNIKNELMTIKSQESERPTTYYERFGNNIKYRSSKYRGVENPTTMNSQLKFITDFFADKSIYYQSVIVDLANISYAIDRHFDNSSTYSAVAPASRNIDFSFCGNKKENTPENLYLLKINYPNYYKRIISAMKILFDDIAEINVEKIESKINIVGAQNVYQLYAKQKIIDEYINCQEMSDGFKRVLNNLIFLSICEIKHVCLVALEEPENSINPTVLGRYIQVIADFSSSFKVIITSHSPFLLEYISLSKVYIALQLENGNTGFRKIKKTYIKRVTERSEKLNVSTGSYIFDLLANEDRYNSEILKDALDI